MVSLLSLWLPVIVAAVVVFIASFLAWMVLPHHKADFNGLPEEDEFLGGLRSQKVAPGQYAFPFVCDYGKLKDPDFKARYDAGPHGMLLLWPGRPDMNRSLVLTFIFYLVVGVFVAYLGRLALGGQVDPSFLRVFRVTGTAAVMAYTLGLLPNAIWYGRSRRSIVMDVIDNVVYGSLTGLVFALLWPATDAATVLPG